MIDSISLRLEEGQELTTLEVDENGVIFGYKILEYITSNGGTTIFSPYAGAEWRDESLCSDKLPHENNLLQEIPL